MKSKQFSKQISGLFVEINEIAEDLQQLAQFALKQASDGNLGPSNQLIYRTAEFKLFPVDNLIKWFESYGVLDWSNEAGELLLAQSGAWNLRGGARKKWYDTPHKLKEAIASNHQLQERLTEENFQNVIDQWVRANPAPDAFGPLGVPADRNRWGAYRLKVKRK